MGLTHTVRFRQGYDCIRFECMRDSPACKPGSGGSHGRHGMTIYFAAQGEAGAVTFTLFTGWLPQYAQPSRIHYREVADWGQHVQPANLGCHSRTPRHEGQEVSQRECEYCDGQPCYCDGSSLNANDAMYSLVNGGDEALWTFLDGYYRSVFEGADYPEPAEYRQPPRAERQSP